MINTHRDTARTRRCPVGLFFCLYLDFLVGLSCVCVSISITFYYCQAQPSANVALCSACFYYHFYFLLFFNGRPRSLFVPLYFELSTLTHSHTTRSTMCPRYASPRFKSTPRFSHRFTLPEFQGNIYSISDVLVLFLSFLRLAINRSSFLTQFFFLSCQILYLITHLYHKSFLFPPYLSFFGGSYFMYIPKIPTHGISPRCHFVSLNQPVL